MTRILSRTASSCFALAVALIAPSAANAADRDSIRETIKAQVRDIVTGINTRNPDLAVSHDAPNVLVIEQGQPNTVGVSADLAGFKQAMAAEPNWRVRMIEEAVDVPESGDMAVYRSTYNQDSSHANVPLTQKVNVIAGWSRHENGAWLMDWYVVSPMEKSHKMQ